MPPRIRRLSPLERLKSYLNPYDFYYWLLQELDSIDWVSWVLRWAKTCGLVLNLLCIVARANSRDNRYIEDDVFGEEDVGAGLFTWLNHAIFSILALSSVFNAGYLFWCKRYYRLFEVDVNKPMPTPSARRVPVDTPPAMTWPLRLLTSLISAESLAASLPVPSHQGAEQYVWELGIWDPHPVSTKMLAFFSPGHVLVYSIFLPTLPSDPHPSVTIFTIILLAVVMNAQLSTLSSAYAQQAKDTTILHKEVFNEYDVKFVQPRMHTQTRDVGTQYSSRPADARTNTVETWTPGMKKSYKINPNPKYLSYVDPTGALKQDLSPRPARMQGPLPAATPIIPKTPKRQQTPGPMVSSATATGSGVTPATRATGAAMTTGAATPGLRDAGTPGNWDKTYSTPNRHQLSHQNHYQQQQQIPLSAIRQPVFRTPRATSTGDGGSLGAYSHANSPLKKASYSYAGTPMSASKRPVAASQLTPARSQRPQQQQQQQQENQPLPAPPSSSPQKQARKYY